MKYITSMSLITLVGVLILLAKDSGECSFTEEYANERIIEALVRANLDPRLLGSASFQKEDCSYSYLYESGNEKIAYIFTGWGKVNKWDYALGESGP